MGSLFKAPAMPAPPPLEMPKTSDVPSLEDQEREQEEKQALAETERKRKGRRSTILTGGTGLNDDAETSQKTLLGG